MFLNVSWKSSYENALLISINGEELRRLSLPQKALSIVLAEESGRSKATGTVLSDFSFEARKVLLLMSPVFFFEEAFLSSLPSWLFFYMCANALFWRSIVDCSFVKRV